LQQDLCTGADKGFLTYRNAELLSAQLVSFKRVPPLGGAGSGQGEPTRGMNVRQWTSNTAED